MDRRNFLKFGAASSAAFFLSPYAKLYSASQYKDKKLFLIILRGGLDGLSMVVPYGDNDYQKMRGQYAIKKPRDENGALNLDGYFGLHPKLGNLKEMYDKKELIIFNAVATPYRNRSHFAAQEVLENGGDKPGLNDGWINRLILNQDNSSALSLTKETPFILSGESKNVSSYYPQQISQSKRDLTHKISQLYLQDEKLSKPVEQFIDIDKIAAIPIAGEDVKAYKNSPPASELERLIYSASQIMKQNNNFNIAVFNVGGWDTHRNQGVVNGVLANRMQNLAKGLSKIKTYMAKDWKDCCFLCVTEFGRTVQFNGTNGTDHGSASVALLGGGAVKGGKILGDWPLLNRNRLYQKRDLLPTTDMRKIFKSTLRDHLKVDYKIIEDKVFPGSMKIRYFNHLFKSR